MPVFRINIGRGRFDPVNSGAKRLGIGAKRLGIGAKRLGIGAKRLESARSAWE
jgi:hypothetical protein